MARIKGPLLSQDARGKIAERLVFSLRSSGQQARFQKEQKDVITEARTSQRAVYLEAANAWSSLTDLEKLDWEVQAKELDFTGYNLFMRFYLNNYVLGRSKAYYGIAIFGNTIYGET